jgi:hypothetical protein
MNYFHLRNWDEYVVESCSEAMLQEMPAGSVSAVKFVSLQLPETGRNHCLVTQTVDHVLWRFPGDNQGVGGVSSDNRAGHVGIHCLQEIKTFGNCSSSAIR